MKIENTVFIYFNLMPAVVLGINRKAEKQADSSEAGAVESEWIGSKLVDV